MVPIASLWLPILLAAVAVFVISSVLHMAFEKWHAGDYVELPNQEAARAAIGPLKIPPGDYFLPRATSHAAMRNEEFKKKMVDGPIVMMTVYANGLPQMGSQLGLWFLYALVVSFLAGLLPSRALGAGANHHSVVHYTGFCALLAYTGALWPASIWYKRSWLTTLKAAIDGFLYAAVTGLIFSYFWPR